MCYGVTIYILYFLVVDVHIMYLGCFLKLIACEIESVEMCECGEVGEGGELVGVE